MAFWRSSWARCMNGMPIIGQLNVAGLLIRWHDGRTKYEAFELKNGSRVAIHYIRTLNTLLLVTTARKVDR